MLYLKINNHNKSEIIRQVNKTLDRGGIVCLPFDTVYGFICDPKNNDALEKIFKLKNRDTKKTIGLVSLDFKQLEKIAVVSFPKFIKKRIPGRYTFILKVKHIIFSPYCYKEDTIAVRIPNNKLVFSIIKEYGGAIAQTSANKAGFDSCLSFKDLSKQFSFEELSHIDLIIDGGRIINGRPSRIYDLTERKPFKIKR